MGASCISARVTLCITAPLDLRCGPFGNRCFERQGAARTVMPAAPKTEPRSHCNAATFFPIYLECAASLGGDRLRVAAFINETMIGVVRWRTPSPQGEPRRI